MRHIANALGAAAVLLVTTGACHEGISPDIGECTPPTPDSRIGLPIAPPSQRRDLAQPSFANPTSITNQLFPIAQLESAVLLGFSDGVPLRVETTLLPGTRTIEWEGRQVETLVSQYVAYLDGRLHEVALDFYAQADDGSVWYFGEDVFNYENGVIADTDGTWLACQDGPAAMIMPATPQVGDVYRPENVFGVVFEEVTVQAIDQTVMGPFGPVSGAILVEELHMDGTRETKVFAPGYGEFSTGSGANLEAIALAVPTDAMTVPLPAALAALRSGALAVHDDAVRADWAAASTEAGAVASAWATLQAAGVPPLIVSVMNSALAELSGAVAATDGPAARQASLKVLLSGLDLKLLYRPRADVDLARLDVWSRQLALDVETGDAAGVASDVAIIGWVVDRVAYLAGDPGGEALGRQARALRDAARRNDRAGIIGRAASLRQALRSRGVLQ